MFGYIFVVATSVYSLNGDFIIPSSTPSAIVNQGDKYVNVSGTITTDYLVSPVKIQFIDQQTSLSYNGTITLAACTSIRKIATHQCIKTSQTFFDDQSTEVLAAEGWCC